MKEIIIDGVDISQCEYYYEDNMCMDDTNNGYCIKEDCQIYNLFKQLQQKEKEVEELKAENVYLRECNVEDLKEIEELKEQLEVAKGNAPLATQALLISYDDFKKSKENWQKIANEYKQAIDKIKEICNSNLDVECPECTIFVTKGTCKECLSEQILQTINEVEE